MRTWPDLTALELLVAVADHGGLSSGARAIGMAQPNASRSIARLERSLGLPLVIRATTGSRLTPAGILVVDWARDVLQTATALTQGAAAIRQPGAGSITVSASQTVAEHLLPAWLSTLRTELPEATVTIQVHNTTAVIDDVLHGRCSIGFIEGPNAPRGVHHTVVAHDELILVAAPGHPWTRRRTPVRVEELVGTPLITREKGSGTRVALDEALGDLGPVNPALEMSSNAAVRVSVTSGTAPAVLSRLAVQDALSAKTLCEVPIDELDLARPLRAIWSGPRRLRGLAAELVTIASR
ncbi:LysR family transcriptional regulator [Leekyejoonella antrihumi]|nr:LysR family transcriptional regulator [Leekyejoonella antrihumi]